MKFIVSKTIVTLVSLACVSSQEDDDGFCDAKMAGNPGSCSEEPTVVCSLVMGRLGNHLWNYMTGVAIAAVYGLTYAVSRETKDFLSKYFEGVDQFKSLEDDYCFFNEFYDQFRVALDTRIEEYYEAKSGLEVTVTRQGATATIQPVSVVLEHGKISHSKVIESEEFKANFKVNYGNLPHGCRYRWQPFYGSLGDLDQSVGGAYLFLGNKDLHGIWSRMDELGKRSEFEDTFFGSLRIKKSLKDRASKTLDSFRASHLTRHQLDKGRGNMTFVGIHVRRTDHLAYEAKHAMKELDASYYLKAMALFRKKFKAASRKKRLIFVVVSDDIDWSVSKLEHKVKERDIYFNRGSLPDDEASIGHDFALLAHCNHTIESHGSFTWFAGAFAGGMVITPDHFDHYRRSDKQNVKAYHQHPLDNPLPRLPVY